jgi:hypothetical protein
LAELRNVPSNKILKVSRISTITLEEKEMAKKLSKLQMAQQKAEAAAKKNKPKNQ